MPQICYNKHFASGICTYINLHHSLFHTLTHIPFQLHVQSPPISMSLTFGSHCRPLRFASRAPLSKTYAPAQKVFYSESVLLELLTLCALLYVSVCVCVTCEMGCHLALLLKRLNGRSGGNKQADIHVHSQLCWDTQLPFKCIKNLPKLKSTKRKK